MKILNIQSTNFKSFKELNFDLKKINIILGPNNSGKSNILKLFLLLKQTFTSNLESPLILNGNIITLGSYKDITYRFNNKNIRINYRIISPYDPARSFYDKEFQEEFYDLQFQYSYDEKLNKIYLSNVKIYDLQEDFQILDFEKDKRLIINNRPIEDYLDKIHRDLKELIMKLEIFPEFPIKNIRIFKRLRLRLETATIKLHQVYDLKEVFDYFSKIFSRFLSSKWNLQINYNTKFIEFSPMYSRDLEHIYDLQRTLGRLNSPAVKRYLTSDIKEKIRDYDKLTLKIINRYEELKDLSYKLNKLRGQFTSYCEKMHYIGPLREYPKRYYPITGEIAEEVGYKGEFVPYLLKKSKEKLDFWDYQFKDLDKKVQNWLLKFEMAKEVEIKPYKEISEYVSIIYQEYFSGVKVNASDMGFGTSQVMPIIIEGFLSERDPILMIEQPEIHLHPKAQSILGDLFIEIANEDKTIIVETHSEHLIRRLQRRIAENKISNEDVIFYYVTIGKEGSQLQRLEIDEEGYIENIPEGFFDEDYKEASEHLRIIAEKKENIK